MQSSQQLTIDIEQTALFAELSGDRNPLHLNSVVARRLMFGGTVPHGVHLTLAALDLVFRQRPDKGSLSSLVATYAAPAVHGAPVDISLSINGNEVRATVRQNAVELQRISAAWRISGLSVSHSLSDRSDWIEMPLELDFESLVKQSGKTKLSVDIQKARALFPSVCSALPAQQVAAVLACTRVVGMQCPGLHSVFAELNLTFESPLPSAASELLYRASRADPRMSLVRIQVEGPGVAGQLTALFRPPPVHQSSLAALSGMVRDDEFRAQKAIVVGGSRGLGEAAVKLIAAGGGEVLLTFASGQEDAMRVVEECRSGGRYCEALHFDVLSPSAEIARLPGDDHFRPTHIYYFASPSIRPVRARDFDTEIFARYCKFYVTGLVRTVQTIERWFGLADKVVLFYPSTAFLDNVPSGFAEYAAAKSAGELAGGALQSRRPGIQFVCKRLPPLRTDQTNGFRGAKALMPEAVLLPIFREVTN